MLNIFAHPYLSHHSVFVSVDACKLANMSVKVLQAISKLKSINVAQSELYVTINY